uniref:HAT C-terminal dimerisation domain-containing protein n=1 Tax=Meloidogyne enterolobii TaxID=390850 RepID=A0A6V7XD76_MELEN|nr:unnamed protein product [Meloidogyne enterolobii]
MAVKIKLIEEIRSRFSHLEKMKVFAVAHYLDPRFKDQFVSNRLDFLSKITNWIKIAADFNEDIISEEINGETEQDDEVPPTKKIKMDFFSSRAKKYALRRTPTPTQAGSKISNIEMELNIYKNNDLEALDSDPLNYWKTNEKLYPLLVPVVQRYLSAQATSVESERIFSVARDVFDYRRSLLSPVNAEMLFF